MNRSLSIAIIVIAIYSISTGASGQNGVYRCGNSYSQKPCTDAVVVDVQDARTAEQKIQADATIRRDTATANAIEKERLAQEARQRAAQAKLTAAEKKQSAPKPQKTADALDTADTTAAKSKRKKSTSAKQKATPEVFIASAPTDKNKPGARPAKRP
ncbi:hypothetical protein HZ993_09405 [Rhodoferax sp. AJA081-3]|uniref:hypothetical protein n=1 Tax=Rhodoferax sp. AJA081-3 TaxID=2752316 RepID=UPI001ADFBBCD|nr:hypothetical protein [Rhodoferax sp. AJA081-3]QTN29995.1 hypothetical protein HZ993_09405 [Rhodoferax sp. AJA081-3]